MNGNVIFKDKESMNIFRGIVDKALVEDVITEQEALFSLKLAERFRSSIEKTIKKLYSLQGEIARLKENEDDIFGVAEDLVSAAPLDDIDDIDSSVEGLIVKINNRFKSELESKARTLLTMQGELAQLQANEKVLMDIINNVLLAHDRSMERANTVVKVREGKQRDKTIVIEE